MGTIAVGAVRLAVADRGSGPPLLCITGVGYGAWYWERLAADLGDRVRVIAYDARGVGASTPAGPGLDTATLAGDAAGLLHALGIRRAAVLGHSLGGMVAQELALARPDLVDRLILASTTHGGPDAVPVTPEALEVLTRRDGDPMERFRRGMEVATAPGFPARRPDVIARFLAYRASGPVPPDQWALQVAAGAGHDATERLGAIRCPVLVLTGDQDRVVPPANAELLARRIPGARVRVLEGLGHHFPFEDPEATAAAVGAFVLAR